MLQCQLRVSHPQDSAEREAESVAAEVVNAPQQPASASDSVESHPEVATEVLDELRSTSSDSALPRPVRDMMEPRFGADFSGVRIHRDREANALAEALNANAFTVGREIFFGEGQFAPASAAGRRVIAHELTHVVQQGAAGPRDQATNVAARSHFSVEHPASDSGLFRQEQVGPATENPAPIPEPSTTEQQPTDQDEEDGQDGEMIEFALPALNDLQGSWGIGPLIQRQPKTPPPAPPAQPAQPAPAPAAKPAAKVTPDPIAVLDSAVGQTKSGTDGETNLALQSHFKWTKSKKGSKITKYSGTVSRNIQTTYLPGVDKKSNSGYGRGTTDEDKKTGNTSLEFHESRHVEDLKAYLDSHPLPEFTGKERMTVDEFKDAVRQYDDALNTYIQHAAEQSKQATDCVGTKEKSCK